EFLGKDGGKTMVTFRLFPTYQELRRGWLNTAAFIASYWAQYVYPFMPQALRGKTRWERYNRDRSIVRHLCLVTFDTPYALQPNSGASRCLLCSPWHSASAPRQQPS